ncbi:hypothetical protein HET73_00315 [Wolbachia endosymbiont of Atemnus politus]|uniref:reverse transcriptase domain-containing protein n=1 Tax=Wolbachia endosymbiont of Atemnus politus TaxID=2682840 RepID=UPI001572AC05|nr:reverse transcriptase domain-containing protein [Wolbachia endosymbiont of Atemnus politus]NSM56165.1 hypothetical protein [Wolbachia endosymbiont of Atemnus politus]
MIRAWDRHWRSSKPSGRSLSDKFSFNTRGQVLKVATWNVRTLFQPGKLDNLVEELHSMDIDIAGISEVRWTECGKITRKGYEFFYSGGDRHERGVGIAMKKKVAQCLLGWWPIDDRMILAKIAAKPFNLAILQVYAPTSDHDDDEIELFYEKIQSALKHLKSQDFLIILGDFNAKIGNKPYQNLIGKYGLGERNERGSRLIQFCSENELVVANTLFKHHPRKLYTWKNPDDTIRNQIDYILIKNRFKNSLIQTKTYPGADISSDHNPVVSKLNIKLKRVTKRKEPNIFDIGKLKDTDTLEKFTIEVKNRFEILNENSTNLPSISDPNLIELKWLNVKNTLKEAAEVTLSKRTSQYKKDWMTEEILNLMKLRKRYKNKNRPEYHYLNKNIKYRCRLAKEEWYNNKCKEIEDLQKQNNNYNVFRKIEELTGKKKIYNGNRGIKDPKGNVLLEKNEIINRWTTHIKNLYKGRVENINIDYNLDGPTITKEEVMHAIKQMKSGKTPGPDQIFIEMLKTFEVSLINEIVDIFNLIYNSGQLPDDLCKSIFINIPKKPNSLECDDFRQISIMSHMTKILLKIILNRITQKTNEISDTQTGFQKDKGTRESIFNFRSIIERGLEVNKDIYICFIDYTKAFDNVDHQRLFDILSKSTIDGKDLRLLINLYNNQKSAVKIDSELSDYFKIGKGVRQGCVLSPLLFNLYSEEIFKDLDSFSGIVVGGRNITNLRYADDTVLISDSFENLQNLLDEVNSRGKNFGLQINYKKTKSMIISKSKLVSSSPLIADENKIENVSSYIYLGHCISSDGRCNQEIKRRLNLARTHFMKRKSLFTSKELSLQTRLRLIKCYIWPIALYGMETWTMGKNIRKRIKAFEMWTIRRAMHVSWEERITNEDVLRMAGVEREIMNHIMQRKTRYFGHIIRKNDIQRLLLEGRIEGTRSRGRQRLTWFDNIKDWTNHSYSTCTRLASSRTKWRTIVVNLRDGEDT